MEIVIALGILAIAGMLTYSSWGKYKARSCGRYAAMQFVQDLRFAREQALVRSTNVYVKFGRHPGYTIYAGPTIDPVTHRVDPDHKGTVIKTGELYEKYGPPLTMTPEEGEILFTHLGTLNSDATTVTRVTFGTVPGIVKSITVLPTGFSRLE
ncbi:MAG: GspH/FimT family pseudopilin [Patescibacteria group bacterium]